MKNLNLFYRLLHFINDCQYHQKLAPAINKALSNDRKVTDSPVQFPNWQCVVVSLGKTLFACYFCDLASMRYGAPA